MRKLNSKKIIIPKLLKLILISVLLFVHGNTIHSQSKYSWSVIPNSIYNDANFQDLYFIDANTGWLIHLYGMIYKTTDGGYNWTRTDSIYIGGFTDVEFINGTTGWISSASRNLFKTIDGGSNLVQVTNFSNPVPSGLTSIHLLDDDFVYGCGNEQSNAMFVKSSNGGASWMTKDLLSYATGLSDCYMFDENVGLAGGRKQVGSERTAVILRTSDGGNSWNIAYQGNSNLESIQKFDFINSLTGYASVERITYSPKHVLKTTNGGINWIELSYPNFHEHGIGFINENTGWIGGDFNPTYGTTDGGQTWSNANIGEFLFGYQFFGDTLGYACGEKIYKYSKVNSIGINVINSEIPERFELLQNFPNPFNPVTSIEYSVKSGGRVLLSVYDNTGRIIATPVDQYHSPGTYHYNFDASGMSSGVYFYSLSADGFYDVKKFVLLK